MLRGLTAFGRAGRSIGLALVAAVLVPVIPSPGLSEGSSCQPSAASPIFLDQGWTPEDRETFYTTAQGSRLMPYAWFKALRRIDVDAPFACDQLERYGYIPAAASARSPEGLPVGFVVDPSSGDVGLTCAACHTARVEFADLSTAARGILQIDGAPSSADFQLFLTELREAAQATSASSERFERFAHDVLGAGYSAGAKAELKSRFDAWLEKFADFLRASLPETRWGPRRMDAFGMTFNRVAGDGLGIGANRRIAGAPVRYPFLWNASRQDRTQWNGSAPNGLYIYALGRNVGEVLGGFADFAPAHDVTGHPNSADMVALQVLEELIVRLKPPAWPTQFEKPDPDLVARGEIVFATECERCHGAHPRSTGVPGALDTPVVAVGTDPRACFESLLTADSGPLAGSAWGGKILAPQAAKFDILTNAIGGSLVYHLGDDFSVERGIWRALIQDYVNTFLPGGTLNVGLDLLEAQKLVTFFYAKLKDFGETPERLCRGQDGKAGYEARVLNGIWAAAPYLHNGSVSSLWDVLMPPCTAGQQPSECRRPRFMAGGRDFDQVNVGFFTNQWWGTNRFTLETDAANANGNGNGGHPFGTTLPVTDKKALLAYLKTL
jgi:mono/diheme cytochrome c family protein